MRSFTKLRLLFLAGFFLVAPVLDAAVFVCAECGYERSEGSKVCSHCKAKLPDLPPESSLPDSQSGNVTAAGRIKFIDDAVVENEIKIARKYLENGDFEIANLLARNAATLEMLADPGAKGDRPGRIAEIRKKSETGGMMVAHMCPTCGGTGKYVMQAQGLDGTTTSMEVSGKSCMKCSGTGKIMRSSTMDERKFKLGRGMSAYMSLQQGRRFTPLGSAWIPAELEGNLTLKQAVQLKRAVVLPCSDCMGLGRTDCAKCKGQGEFKCAVQGCVNGKVEVKEEGSLVKGKSKKSVKCRGCNGTGFVLCADCRGKGSFMCKKCSGSGERGLCVRCSGQGFISCRKCKGAGTVKELTCAECRGEGIQECSACAGDGRKK